MKTRKMKGILCCLMIVMLVLSLTACGTPEKPKAQEASAGFQAALNTQTDCTLHVVGHYENFEALEAEFNRFGQYYPNVKLNYTYMDDYKNIINTAVSSAEAPDIFFVFPSMLGHADYQPLMDACENLADPKLGIDLSCIRSSILYKDAQGRQPAVPIFSETYGMLVNEEIFEKEKITIPTTYTELLSACEALNKAGYASPMMGHSSLLVYPLYFPYFCAEIKDNAAALKALNAMEPGAGEYARGALSLAADFMGRGFVDVEACNALENDYNAVILRFFEGDVPMMLAKSGTVSGTEKRESRSEAFTAHPFRYSFHPVPSTEKGGYLYETVSLCLGVNKNSKNLDMANEFMRFLVRTSELNQMAQAKRMVTPCIDMSLDGVYASFGKVAAGHVINSAELGLDSAADTQTRRAGLLVSTGKLTVDEAVAAFGTLE